MEIWTPQGKPSVPIEEEGHIFTPDINWWYNRAIDFCDDIDEDNEEEDANLSKDQLKNKKLLRLLTRHCLAKVFPSTIAMEIYKQFRARSIYPVAKFRGTLDISSQLKIQVLVYGKTREEKFPSLKKHSQVVEKCIFMICFLSHVFY